MSGTTQRTLFDYEQQYEWTTKTFTKTVIFHLRQPTERKRERLDAAIKSAENVRAETARRMPSVPRKYWGVAKPKNSTWYQWAQEMDSHLSNKDVHENIQTVRETFRSWQSKGYEGEKPAVSKFKTAGACAFYYAKPTYTIYDGAYYVSLPLAAGRGERELLPLRDGDYLREYADKIRGGELSKGRAELMRSDNEYQLHQVVRTDVDVIANPVTAVGVDMGLNNLATAGAVRDGDKIGAEVWSGDQAAEMRTRFSDKRSQAQTEARFEDLRDEETRYIEHVCHTISREVIEWALAYERPQIVMEDLTDIRDSFIEREREFTADKRRALHSWPFRKLQTMIEYKAQEAGIPTETVDAAYTSIVCNECGHRSREGRSGVHFHCTECGYEVNADVNGAFNIALKN